MDFEPAVDRRPNHARALLVRKRNAVVGDLDGLDPEALGFRTIGLDAAPALGREDVFEELSADEGLDLVFVIEVELGAIIVFFVEPRRADDELAKIDVGADQTDRKSTRLNSSH